MVIVEKSLGENFVEDAASQGKCLVLLIGYIPNERLITVIEELQEVGHEVGVIIDYDAMSNNPESMVVEQLLGERAVFVKREVDLLDVLNDFLSNSEEARICFINPSHYQRKEIKTIIDKREQHLIFSLETAQEVYVLDEQIKKLIKKYQLIYFVGYKISTGLLDIIDKLLQQGYSNLFVISNQADDNCLGVCQDETCLLRKIRKKVRSNCALIFNQKQNPDIIKLLPRGNSETVWWVINIDHPQYKDIRGYLACH